MTPPTPPAGRHTGPHNTVGLVIGAHVNIFRQTPPDGIYTFVRGTVIQIYHGEEGASNGNPQIQAAFLHADRTEKLEDADWRSAFDRLLLKHGTHKDAAADGAFYVLEGEYVYSVDPLVIRSQGKDHERPLITEVEEPVLTQTSSEPAASEQGAESANQQVSEAETQTASQG
jgi:hypothetical protein